MTGPILARLALATALALPLVPPLPLAAQDGPAQPPPAPGNPARSPKQERALSRWIALPHDRQLLVLETLGVAMQRDFFDCVCRMAGYGSSGTAQYYEPDTIGTYDKRYSCQHPGPPCIVSGYGCTRHDLPTDPKIFENCAARPELTGGNPLDQILSALENRNAPAKPVQPGAAVDCARARAVAGLGAPGTSDVPGVPPDRVIYALSPEARQALATLQLAPDTQQKLEEALVAAMQKSVELGQALASSADEIDLRFDFGFVEVGASADRKGRIHLSEITYKEGWKTDMPVVGEVDTETSLKFGLGDPDDPDSGGTRLTGGKIGFAWETPAGELKYGIDIDSTKQIDDYYDGEWQKESEYGLVRAVESAVAKLDFYGGGSVTIAKVRLPGDVTVDIGPEFAWKVRDRYSNWLFADMHEALDSLLDNQKRWEDQRHAYVAQEAARFGIDARCFSTGEAIRLTHDAYARQSATDPGVAAPFGQISSEIAARRARAAEAAAHPPPAPKPVLPRAPAPENGVYRHEMLR
ncbi:hypothetical protein [Rhodobacter aestuarii]|uniref:hypothetical protein n=1 Tax=Rhodobacter aestuarii TaxID=453582 RepID=UPI00158857AA|nr:hypothetical protein [Rhodobacter aestuarii]